MVLLCFLVDLQSFSPPLLSDLKEALLQLANFYALSASSDSLIDRIALCYLFYSRISSSVETKIAYCPRGNFCLHDFHHAVNHLPNDAFFPNIHKSDIKLRSILNDEVLYSWGAKDIERRVIVLSSCLVQNIDSITQEALLEAAEKCVFVEFVLFEEKSCHLGIMSEKVNDFARHISYLENCSLQTCLPDMQVLSGLVKKWLRNLKDDQEELLQARIIFNNYLVGSVDQISCYLRKYATPTIDVFSPCKTCRCHGALLDDMVADKVVGQSFCPVTGQELGVLDLIENSVKIGKGTVLFPPSHQNFSKSQKVSAPIMFNVIERTNLGSLSEGVMIDDSFVVTPSCHEMEGFPDEFDKSELNNQLFQGLCRALYSLDQGLVCSSSCNIKSMMEATFICYYILQASNSGPMLLRRLAGSEEVCHVSDFNQLFSSPVNVEIENSVRASLLKVETRDYNPVLHERGFHQKLNLLVKESLQFGSVPYNLKNETSEVKPTQSGSFRAEDDAEITPDLNGEEKGSGYIAEEWEQLIAGKISRTFSPGCISLPKVDQSLLLPLESYKQVDVKTSRILERLEVPKELRAKAVSPLGPVSISSDASLPVKRPLIPLDPNQCAEQGETPSQLIKPNFRKLKRRDRWM